MAITLTNPSIAYLGPGNVKISYTLNGTNSDTATVTFPSGNVQNVTIADAAQNVVATHTLSARSVNSAGYTSYTLTMGATLVNGTLSAICSAL